MQAYRRIPQVVHAMQLTDETAEIIAQWTGGDIVEEIDPRDSEKKYKAINVPTLSGNERLSQGQFLVRHANGQFELIGATAFMDQFEPDR